MIEGKLLNGNNRYSILYKDSHFVHLKCEWFVEQENLGDGIYCTHEGEQIWVAWYHAQHMIFEDVELKG